MDEEKFSGTKLAMDYLRSCLGQGTAVSRYPPFEYDRWLRYKLVTTATLLEYNITCLSWIV